MGQMASFSGVLDMGVAGMSGFAEYEDYDAIGLADLVRRRQVAAEELLEAAIRGEARNPILNAVVMELYDYGRQAIAAGLPDGPLSGVPFLVKDLSAALAGVPTTRACKFFADAVSSEDSAQVIRLKRAGLIIFGKTNTFELGLSLTCEPQFHGATRNPGSEPHLWGLKRRRRGRRRSAHAAGGPWVRWLWLYPSPGRLLRAGWPKADTWTQHHGTLPRRRLWRTVDRACPNLIGAR